MPAKPVGTQPAGNIVSQQSTHAPFAANGVVPEQAQQAQQPTPTLTGIVGSGQSTVASVNSDTKSQLDQVDDAPSDYAKKYASQIKFLVDLDQFMIPEQQIKYFQRHQGETFALGNFPPVETSGKTETQQPEVNGTGTSAIPTQAEQDSSKKA